jgi:hypothetical protein
MSILLRMAIAAWLAASVACGGRHSAGGDADGDLDSDARLDADQGDDADPDIDPRPDADRDRDEDSRPDADRDRDEDSRPDADPGPCPADTVRVTTLARALCVDRFEASRGDGNVAESRVGVAPWTRVSLEEAMAACENAGKRLCTRDEWIAACRGPEDTDFPYGGFYVYEACNGDGVATAPAATGSYEDCEGGFPGLFDLSGNVEEWVSTPAEPPDPDGGTLFYHPLGGSFQASAEQLECTPRGSGGYAAHMRMPDLGFRCCLEP